MAFTTSTPIFTAGSTTDATSYTTASVSVTAGDLLLAIVANGVTTQPAEVISSITGTLGSTLTWAQAHTVLMNSSLVARTSIWWAICPSTTSGTLTFDFGGANTQSNCQWTVTKITGAHASAPIGDVYSLQTAAANPSMSLSPAPAADSMVIGTLVANVSTAAVAGTGWTLMTAGTSQTSPAMRQAVQYDLTAPGTTFGFTLTGTTNKALLAVEINPASTTPLLTPDDSAHAHTADAGSLTQHQVVAPVDSAHAHTADQPTLIQHQVLAPADSAHSHTADSPTISSVLTLAPADSAHAHAAESPTLIQHQTTAPADSAHAHAAESPTLTQHQTVAPADSAHGHTADSPTIAQSWQLAPADSAHGHTSESPSLTQHQVLAPPADSAHSHTADSPTLTQHQAVAPVDSLHTHAAESPSLLQHHTITPADSFHAHTADSPSLGQAGSLAPNDSHHGHTSDGASLTQHHVLVPADSAHGHTSGSPTLTLGSVPIQPDDSTHGHTVDLAALTQHHALTALSSLHTHTSTSPTLRDAEAVTPPERILPVHAEQRALRASAESRVVAVAADPVSSTPAENRTN